MKSHTKTIFYTIAIIAMLFIGSAMPSYSSMINRTGKKTEDITFWIVGDSITAGSSLASTECSSGDTTWAVPSAPVGGTQCSVVSTGCLKGNCLDCDMNDRSQLDTDLDLILDPDADFTMMVAFKFDDEISNVSSTNDPDNVVLSVFLSSITAGANFVSMQPNHSVQTGEQCEPGGGFGFAVDDGSTQTTYMDTWGVETYDGVSCDAQSDDDNPDDCDIGNPCILNLREDNWYVASCTHEYVGTNDRENKCWMHYWDETNGLEQIGYWEKNETAADDLDAWIYFWIGAHCPGPGVGGNCTFGGDVKLDVVAFWSSIVDDPWEMVFQDQAPPEACP